MHYARWQRTGDPTATRGRSPDRTPRMPKGAPIEDRFFSHVLCDVATRCWVWQGFTFRGYARFNEGPGRFSLAHRWAYESFVGPIPDGLTIDHLCRNRSCVNPAHLEPVTSAENTRRGLAAKSLCSNGHPYTSENVMVERTTGRRRCLICKRANSQRYKDRQRSPGMSGGAT